MMKAIYIWLLLMFVLLACKFSLPASSSVNPYQPEVTVFIPQGMDCAKGTWPKDKPLLICIETKQGLRWWECRSFPIQGVSRYSEIATPTDTKGYWPLSSHFMSSGNLNK